MTLMDAAHHASHRPPTPCRGGLVSGDLDKPRACFEARALRRERLSMRKWFGSLGAADRSASHTERQPPHPEVLAALRPASKDAPEPIHDVTSRAAA